MENFNDSKALAIEIAKILDKKKAHDVRVLKVESLTVLTDYFVIASGTSTTQVAALADEVEYELSQKGLEPYSTEGYDSKNWVLLDYSNVIVHVFVPNTRTYYDLEHLWADGEPIDISEYLTPDSTSVLEKYGVPFMIRRIHNSSLRNALAAIPHGITQHISASKFSRQAV